jgi:hypothetical protein
MLEEENEIGDGGVSDEEGEKQGVTIDEVACEAIEEQIEMIVEESNCVLHVELKHEVPLISDDSECTLKLSYVPEDWILVNHNLLVDNPGGGVGIHFHIVLYLRLK